MSQIYDAKSGQLVDVPDDPGANEGVTLINDAGESKVVPKSQQELYSDAGFVPDTPEARQAIEDRQKYGGTGGEIGASAAGLARGLTFGLSDYALARSGLVERETLQKLKEQNPEASTVSELASVAVPLAGEISALGKAGKVLKGAGAGIEGVSAAGQATSKAVKAIVGDSLLGKAAQTGAGAATEALAYNIGHNLSEAVLDDKELTAERLLAHSGNALLLGGGLGFGMPIAAKGLELGLQKGRDALAGLGRIVRDDVMAPAAKAYAETFSKLSGTEAEATLQLVQKPFQAEAAAARKEAVGKVIGYEERDEMLKGFQKQLEDVHDGLAKAKKVIDSNRQGEVGKLLEGVKPQPAIEGAAALSQRVRATAQKMADEPMLYDQAFGKELMKVADDLDHKINGVGFDSAEQVFHSINSLKQTALSDLASFSKRAETMSRAELNAVREVRDLYKGFSGHLEDATVYGEAAARQAAINDAYSTYLKLTGKSGDFRKFFLKGKGVNGLEIDPSKVNTFFNRTGSAREEAMKAALDEWQGAAAKLFDQAENTAKNSAIEFDRKGMESLLGKVADTQKKAAEDLGFVSKVRAQDAFGMAFLNFQKAMGGVPIVGNPISQVVDLALKVSSPSGVARALSAVEGFASGTGARTAKAVGDFVAKASGKAGAGSKRFVAPASVKALEKPLMERRADEDRENRHERFAKRVEQLAQMMSDPAGTAEQLGGGFSALDQTPQLKEVLIQQQLKAAQFLYDKAPRNPSAGKTLNPFVQKWRPSDAELSKWERYVEAVQNPNSVVEELGHGHVTREGVEALKAVYPKMYDDVRTQLFDQVSTIQNQIPYRYRLQLSTMFELPLDTSMDSQFVQFMQSSYKKSSQGASQGYEPSAAAGKLAQSEQTQAQRIAEK